MKNPYITFSLVACLLSAPIFAQSDAQLEALFDEIQAIEDGGSIANPIWEG